jgi:hypothetical protein
MKNKLLASSALVVIIGLYLLTRPTLAPLAWALIIIGLIGIAASLLRII